VFIFGTEYYLLRMTKRKRKLNAMSLLSNKSKSKRSSSRKKPIKSLKRSWFRTPKVILSVLFVLLFASVGIWQLVGSKAAVIDRGTVAYMQTADGCWLAGRVWDGSSCTTKCRSSGSNYIAKTSSHLGYCSGAIATGVGQSSCTSLGRIFVANTGCARRIDQDTTANARQCRYTNNTYFTRSDKPDYCGLECSGTHYIAITACPAPAPTTTTTTSSSFSVWNRDSVNSTYKYLWASGTGVQQNWNGSISSCVAGNISDQARRALINAINFARTVNYLEPIHGLYSATADNNLAAQKAALMMEANNTLNHNPPTSWRCYTKLGGTTAGYSNLSLNPIKWTPLEAVKSMFDEPGGGNYYVGHRRWLLKPDANNFGFGMTNRALAVKVTDMTTDSANPDPLWTMWPSRGYFPSTLEPAGRWSVSTKKGGNMAYANVTVTKNGAGVPIVKQPVKNESGIRSTLVWQMPDNSTSGTYSVTITGARKPDGSVIPAYTYPVYFFTPY
jgi:hypothetical protein